MIGSWNFLDKRQQPQIIPVCVHYNHRVVEHPPSLTAAESIEI